MRKNFLKMVVFSALVVTGLSACGKKEPEHTHNYVFVPEVAATCTNDGTKAYYTCSGCDKIFDADKKETTLEALKIDKLGHYEDLSVSGTYKTNYLVGETFDTTGLVVKKECRRDGCNYGENVTDYNIVYQNASATCVAYGDTKVSIVVDKLSKDITITVDLLPNVIEGVEDSYDLNCCEGVSLEGISAVSGTVAVSYYADEACTEEVDVEDLIGDATYYAKFETVDVDPDYEIASTISTLNVTHNEVESDSYTVIGYKENVCDNCGEVLSKTTNLMTSVNALYEKTAEGELAVAYFGANPAGNANETSEGYRGELGGIYWIGLNADARETVEVVLPAVNFSVYTNVLMPWCSSAQPAWGNQYKISFGIDAEDDLLPIGNYGENFYGNLLFELESPTSLKVTNKLSSGETFTFVVTNEDIIKGYVNLTLSLSIGGYRQFYINKVILNHTTHSGSTTLAPATDKIAYMNILCDVCGEVIGPSTTKMEQNDISIKHTYGASSTDVATSTNTPANAQDDKIIYVFGQNGSTNEYKINLPLVKYDLYDNVTFDLTVASGWFKFGLSSPKSEDTRDHETVKLEVFKNDEGGYKSIMTFAHDGDGQDGVPVVYKRTIDENVENGSEPLSLYVSASDAERTIFLTSIAVADSHEHVWKTQVDKSAIGLKYLDCAKCDAYKETTALSPDIVYTDDGSRYYTSFVVNQSTYGTYVEDGQYAYDTSAQYAKHQVRLPRVVFNRYKKVTFTITTDCYYGVDLVSCWKDGASKDKTCGKATCTLEFVTNGENDVTATLYCGGDTINTTTFTDGKCSGADNFVIHCSVAESVAFCRVSVPELEIDAGEHTHEWMAVSGSSIGEVHNICSICGTPDHESYRTATSDDISYEYNKFGAKLNKISWENVEEARSIIQSDKELAYSTTTDQSSQYIRYKAYLPRVNYSLFKSVEFTFTSNAHYGLGFGSVWKEGGNVDATCGNNVHGTIKIEVGSGSLSLSIIIGGNAVVTSSTTDANIIIGSSNLVIWAGNAESTGIITIGTPVLTPAQ